MTSAHGSTDRPPPGGNETWTVAEAVTHLASVDERMSELIGVIGACELPTAPRGELFPFLVRSIVFQQLNGTAARAIYDRVCTVVGAGEEPGPGDIARTDVDALRSAGVSASKAAAMHALAEFAQTGNIPSSDECAQLSNEALVERLTQVRGIGPWTVHMALMFRLGRADVLPVGDYGVRAGYTSWYRLDAMPTPAQLQRATTHWAPFRSVASWYLWRAVELPSPSG